MEKQLEQLTALMARQMEEAQRREERLTSVLEGLATSQRVSSAGEDGESVSRADGAATRMQVKLPHTATPAPHLSSSASLKEFDAWRHKFEGYVKLTRINCLPPDEQRSALLALLDVDWARTLRFGLTLPDEADLKATLDAMETHLRRQRNVIVDRRDFYSRVQEEGESFDDFLCSIKEIAAFCDFCERCMDNRLRDRVVVGSRDGEAVKRMLEVKDLTLQKAVDICRASENAHANSAVLRGNSKFTLAKVSNYRRDCRSRSFETKPGRCFRCGNSRHSDLKACKALGEICSRCGKKGHFATVCRSAPQAEARKERKQKPGTSPKKVHQLLADVYLNGVHSRPAPRIRILTTHPAGHAAVEWTPDSGAETTVLGENIADSLGIHKGMLRPSGDMNLRAAGQQPLTCLGSFSSNLELGSKRTTTTVSVVKEVRGALLSWFDSVALGILPDNFPTQIQPVTCTPGAPLVREGATASPSDTTSSLGRPPPVVPRWPHTRDPTSAERAQHKVGLIAAFPRVFGGSGTLGEMSGGPMRIQLTDDAQPFAVTAARAIPYSWREDIKKQLDDMLAKDVIEKVDYPTAWCHPVVPVAKNPSGVRLCVDLTRLNKFVKRPTYPVRSPHDAIAAMGPGARWFTTMDAKMGYFQISIAEEDQDLTCFITPWGRYKFKRAVMGLVSSGDEYNRRGDQAIGDVQRTLKIVDDILAYDNSYKEHLTHVISLLQRCDEFGITLNAEKFNFAAPEVDYCGYCVSRQGYTVDGKKVRAISSFPHPQSITDLRSFLGLANQLGGFSPSLAAAAQPLRDLLKPRNVWCWTSQHDAAFEDVKSVLVSPPVLAHFDPALPTRLETDASRMRGLGFVLRQRHGDNWRLTQCGSRFLTDAESRYAVVELELAAVVWGVRKCGTYLTGLPHFELIVDHRPLVPILNSKLLGEIENPRLQRMRMKLCAYSFTARWQSGKSHFISDALSRAPSQDPTAEDDDVVTEEDPLHATVEATLRAVCEEGTQLAPLQDQTLAKVRAAASRDAEYAALRDVIITGFPEHRKDMESMLLPYWGVRSMLTVDDDLIVYGARLLIPCSLRRETLERLHDGHQGVERTKRRARQTVYWPGIDNDITNVVSSCSLCRSLLPSHQNEPLWQDDDPPSRVFESVSADYFHLAGRTFLVYVDRLSGWPYVCSCSRPASAAQLVCFLRSVFADTGVPVAIRTDGGPQFTSSTLRRFLARWGVEHRVTSPYNPRANGHAESAVKIVKKLITTTAKDGRLDCDDFARGLLELRNTPRANGRSPAQVLFGHPLRSTVPAHHRSFAPEWQRAADVCDAKASLLRRQAKERHDATARTLTVLRIGSYVDVQDHVSGRWDRMGVIVGVGKRRDYLVKMGSGRTLWRNRKFLRRHRPMVPASITPSSQHPVEAESSSGTGDQRKPSTAPPDKSNIPAPLRRSARQRREPQRLTVKWGSRTYDDASSDGRDS